jgi:hypothetical protein
VLDLEEVDDLLDARAVGELLAARAPIQIACSMNVDFILRLRPVMMLSRTLMPLNSAMFWNVRAMPCSAASCVSMSRRSRPRNVIVPCCGR